MIEYEDNIITSDNHLRRPTLLLYWYRRSNDLIMQIERFYIIVPRQARNKILPVYFLLIFHLLQWRGLHIDNSGTY